MINRSKQRGISAPLLVIILAFFGFVGVMGLNAFPLVMESLKIESALKSLLSDPTVGSMSKKDLIASYIKRMTIEDVNRINSNNYKDYITLEKKGENVTMRVVYRAETKLVANASLVLDYAFEESN